MIKIYPVDVQIGNIENGISKLSNTSIQSGYPEQPVEYRIKCAIAWQHISRPSGIRLRPWYSINLFFTWIRNFNQK